MGAFSGITQCSGLAVRSHAALLGGHWDVWGVVMCGAERRVRMRAARQRRLADDESERRAGSAPTRTRATGAEREEGRAKGWCGVGGGTGSSVI